MMIAIGKKLLLLLLIGALCLAAVETDNSMTTGEQINWQLSSSAGGGSGVSTNYILGGSVGQFATGPINALSSRLNQGFWQVYETASCCNVPGDANHDGATNVGDAVFLINYVFRAGPAPTCMDEGDTNSDCQVNVGDAVFLINYVFRAGPAPVCGCVGS